jgi:hypothetical protein
MVGGHFVSTIWKPDRTFSLDRFGMNKIFLWLFFFIKQSRLVTIRNPDFFSGFRMVGISNGRDWHKNEFESRTVSGFRMYTYCIKEKYIYHSFTWIKQCRLVTICQPDKFVWLSNGSVITCPVLGKIDHLSTELAWYSHCIQLPHLPTEEDQHWKELNCNHLTTCAPHQISSAS